VAISQKNDLAKFGYILPSTKVGKNRILQYYCLLTYWGIKNLFHKNLVIWFFFFFKSQGEFGSFFPWKIPLYRLKSYFSGRNLAKIYHWKKHCLQRIISNFHPLASNCPSIHPPMLGQIGPLHSTIIAFSKVPMLLLGVGDSKIEKLHSTRI